jgi:hypothetical protein
MDTALGPCPSSLVPSKAWPRQGRKGESSLLLHPRTGLPQSAGPVHALGQGRTKIPLCLQFTTNSF